MTDTLPLGAAVATNYQRHIDVIGQTDQSISGNTILRIGSFERNDGTWHQTAHLVLTAEEREALIGILLSHKVRTDGEVEALVDRVYRIEPLAKSLAAEAGHEWNSLTGGEQDHYRRLASQKLPA